MPFSLSHILCANFHITEQSNHFTKQRLVRDSSAESIPKQHGYFFSDSATRHKLQAKLHYYSGNHCETNSLGHTAVDSNSMCSLTWKIGEEKRKGQAELSLHVKRSFPPPIQKQSSPLLWLCSCCSHCGTGGKPVSASGQHPHNTRKSTTYIWNHRLEDNRYKYKKLPDRRNLDVSYLRRGITFYMDKRQVSRLLELPGISPRGEII